MAGRLTLPLLALFACSPSTSAIAPTSSDASTADSAVVTDSSRLDADVVPDAADASMDAALDTSPPRDTAPADSAMDSGPPPRPTDPFGAPRLIAELSDPGAFDDDPTLTGDRLVIVFNSNRGGGIDNLFMSERASTSSTWSPPRILDEINSGEDETTPEISEDGLTLYFASARTGSSGGLDIYRSTRATRADRWSTPERVDVLSSTRSDSAVAPVLAETLTAIVIEGRGDPRLFESRRASASSPWGAPVDLGFGVRGVTDRSAMLETTGLGLWFDSNRGGDFDIYVAVRSSLDAPFGEPSLVSELSTSSTETDPWISPDLRHIVFVSNRTGSYQLYEASR